MRAHLLKIVWVCLLACFCTSLLALRGAARTLQLPELGFAAVFLAGIGSLGYLTARIVILHRKLERFVRQLLTGDYTAHVAPSRWITDEATAMETMLKKLAEQLQAYDALRASRVGMNARALNAVLRNVKRAVIIADVEKYQFRFNPAALALFGAEQDTCSFEALENLPANRPFMALFKWIVRTEKVPVEREITIQLLPYGSQRTSQARIVPLKDKAELVQMVLIFLMDEDHA